MSFTVAFNSAIIFMNMVGIKAILDSFIFNFPLGILTVIVTVL